MRLQISGVVPFTTIDYPDALAAILFCQGCPWRCRYCHNAHLQPFSTSGSYVWEEIVEFLKARRQFLDAVVFSGGEPTLQKGLSEAMRELKSLGFKIGLHTAGIHPALLRKVLPLVDWIGLDIKAPFALYERITNLPRSGEGVRESARLVLDSKIPYEFRTTVHPHLLSSSELMTLCEEIASMGAKHYALQQFRPDEQTDPSLTERGFQNPWDEAFLNRLKALFDTFCVR